MKSTTCGLLLSLLLWHLTVALLLPMADRKGPATTSLAYGVCAGQVNLIALWTALATGKRRFRIPMAIGLTTLLAIALLLGELMAAGYFDLFPQAAASVVIALAPLGLVSSLVRWSLSPPTSTTTETPALRQFRLLDILIGMTVVGAVLAVGRHVLSNEAHWHLDLYDIIEELIPYAAIAANAVLVAIPCLCAAYFPTSSSVRWRSTLVAGVALLLYAVTLAYAEIVLNQ